MSKKLRVAAVAPVVTAMVLLAACGGPSTGTGSGSGSGAPEIRFVQQPWEDLVVETQMASDILTKLGYRTSTQEVDVPLAAQALATGKADAYLGNWWPSQKPVFDKLITDGKIKVGGTLLSGTSYAPVVPGYVKDKYGISSLADLAKHGDLFGKKILGIEPGTPGNQYILDAIEKNAYGLGDWKLVPSSTAAMLAEVGRAAAKQQPVVFLGWTPHWMAIEYKAVFLADPQGVWPGAGEIRVLSRAGLDKDYPNVTRLLSQMKVDIPNVSQWIYDYDKQHKSAKEIAKTWLDANSDTVKKWLDGVTTVSGKPGAGVVASGSW
ncbi:MAG: hypothetical protein JWQ95_2097 [Sphaerisporangium sp.]|jgi:glycine betaine/proline transport system substrate-binding protein|nr:hypothetical protein [Sphaerisporangium sp.]